MITVKLIGGARNGRIRKLANSISPPKVIRVMNDARTHISVYEMDSNPYDDFYIFAFRHVRRATPRERAYMLPDRFTPTTEHDAMRTFDPLKSYTAIRFTDRNSTDKLYAIELRTGMPTPSPGDYLVADSGSKFQVVQVAAQHEIDDFADHQLCAEYVAIGSADISDWKAEQDRKVQQAEAREIMKRARARYVEELDFANLKGLMTPEERKFVASAFQYEDLLDIKLAPVAD